MDEVSLQKVFKYSRGSFSFAIFNCICFVKVYYVTLRETNCHAKGVKKQIDY